LIPFNLFEKNICISIGNGQPRGKAGPPGGPLIRGGAWKEPTFKGRGKGRGPTSKGDEGRRKGMEREGEGISPQSQGE